MADAPISINIAVGVGGALPTPPVTIWANLITLVAAENPGYTVLPGGLIEDLASTATYAIALIDSAAIETINSLTPFGANAYLLVELGNIYGVPQGQDSNTSVFVQFASNTPGVQILPGFIVGDGVHQYVVQDAGVIKSDNTSDQLFCLATAAGSWPVPANSVTQIVSSLPGGYTLTCTNLQVGTPSAGAQTQEAYAAAVLQAGLVAGQGTGSMLKTLLGNVPGVQPRLVSAKVVTNGWEIICGGGDPFDVASAIYNSGIDISTLVGSVTEVTGITKANPGVVTTDIEHGFTTGETGVHIAGVVGMTGANGGPYTVTRITDYTFSFGVDTTGFGTYVSGGVVTPNVRNVTADIVDYPDTYSITYVNPVNQIVTVQLQWNTVSPNVVSTTAVAQLGTPAIVNFINAIPVGAPINLLSLQNAFINAVVSLFGNNPSLISALDWTISINGVATSPLSGTSLIFGDVEGYFTVAASGVTISQI